MHVNRPPVDDFGNVVRPNTHAGIPPRDRSLSFDERWRNSVREFFDRWEISTSTYGGDTLTDCIEV